MKFTKLTSTILSTATVLAVLAPTTTAFAATVEGNSEANGGTELPMTDNTEMGISFGDNSESSNTGYLRLQMVPHVLDFGNHTEFMEQFNRFDAAGHNLGTDTNDRYGSYKNKETNKTAILNTSDDNLDQVRGTAYATVVDKQITRESTADNPVNTKQSGTWTLSVKSDDVLTANNGEAIPGAKLSLAHTKYGRTENVFGLTNEDQDRDFSADRTVDDADVSQISESIGLDVDGADSDTVVATAKDKEGQGANVFGWNRNEILLTLPKNTQVTNATYTAHLTWTLSTGITG